MNQMPKNPHPGDVLKHDFIEELKISAYQLAKDIGVSQSLLSQIINGKRSITSDMAMRLSKYFGNSAEFWINYQMAYDIRELKRKKTSEYSSIVPFKKKSPSEHH
ncbi:MAG: HigA family addiction module antidote protein [Leptospira sp.]|nr:HigA family addiction module antidote protein [Leptospira sp.]